MKWPRFSKSKTLELAPLEGYELWASSYSQEVNPIKNYSNQAVQQLLPNLQGKEVLDVGCGTGYFCLHAINKGATRVVGVDFSEAMLVNAKKNCPQAEYYCADAASLTFEPASFDTIICALVLGHLESIIQPLLNFTGLLRPAGCLILSDFHPQLTRQQMQRTFKDAKTGKTFAIRHYEHPINDTTNCISSMGLSVVHLEEPRWRSTPIIYAIKAIKK